MSDFFCRLYHLYKRKLLLRRNQIAQIRVVFFDVDGVLTDGRLYYDDQGEALKAFSAYDGVGIALLRSVNIKVVVVSARCSQALEKRMQDLKVDELVMGEHNKLAIVKRWCEEHDCHLNHAVFVGDDIVDLPAMKAVGFSIAPANAYRSVLKTADWVTITYGGYGVAREVADWVVSAQKKLDSCYQQLFIAKQ